MSEHKKMTPLERLNLFLPPPAMSKEEVFQTLVQTPHVLFEKIVSDGHATPAEEWYEQERDEWVVLLTGTAGLRFQNRPEIMELKPGDCIIIPAHVRHRVEWTDDKCKTIWLALHYNGE